MTRRERMLMPHYNESHDDQSSKPEQKHPLLLPKYALSINPSKLIAYLKDLDYVSWPKKLLDNPAKDMTKYFKFRKNHSPHTIDCKALRVESAKILKKEHLRESSPTKGERHTGSTTSPKSEGPSNRSKTHHQHCLFGSPQVSFAGVQCSVKTR